MTMFSSQWFASSASSYVTRAVHCETDDDASRGADLTGASDGKEITVSFWILTTATAENYILTGAPAGPQFHITHPGGAGGEWRIEGFNASNAKIMALVADTPSNTGSWVHLMFSADLAATTGHVYRNNSEDQKSGATLTDDTMDLTDTDWFLFTDGTAQLSADIADLWIDFNYIDLSDADNRAKFIDGSGKPVDLGDDGSTPTGTAPIMYFKLADSAAVATFYTNKGSGGGFGSVSGTLTEASSSPSD